VGDTSLDYVRILWPVLVTLCHPFLHIPPPDYKFLTLQATLSSVGDYLGHNKPPRYTSRHYSTGLEFLHRESFYVLYNTLFLPYLNAARIVPIPRHPVIKVEKKREIFRTCLCILIRYLCRHSYAWLGFSIFKSSQKVCCVPIVEVWDMPVSTF